MKTLSEQLTKCTLGRFNATLDKYNERKPPYSLPELSMVFVKEGDRTVIAPSESPSVLPTKLMFISNSMHVITVKVLPPELESVYIPMFADASHDLLVTIKTVRSKHTATGGILHILIPGNLFQDTKVSRILSIEMGYLGFLGDVYEEFCKGDQESEYWAYDPLTQAEYDAYLSECWACDPLTQVEHDACLDEEPTDEE